MPEFLVRLTHFKLPVAGRFETLPTEVGRESADITGAPLGPTGGGGHGRPTIRRALKP